MFIILYTNVVGAGAWSTMISGVLLMVAVISGIVCGETPRPSGARAAFKDAGQAERHLLAALGMKRRPVADKSKVEIPAAMLELYKMQLSNEFDTTGLPLPGRHVKSANTARTYLHRGECCIPLISSYKYCSSRFRTEKTLGRVRLGYAQKFVFHFVFYTF